MQAPTASNPQGSTFKHAIVWYRRNKELVWGACGAAALGYIAYRAYTSETLHRAKKNAKDISNTINNYSQALSSASSAVSLITSDLHAFLNSSSDEVPQSLKQLSKLLQATELQSTIQTTVSTVVQGISAATANTASGPSTMETIIEAVLSDRGRSLVGMAVGIASKNATAAFCDYLKEMSSNPQGPSTLTELLNLLASDRGERVLSLLVTKSIRTAVSSYVDATAGYNMYNDLFSSLSRQEHRDAMTDITSRMIAVFCQEVLSAYHRASTARVADIAAGASSDSSAPEALVSSAGGNSTTEVVHSDVHAMDANHIPASRVPSLGASRWLQAHSPTPLWLSQVVHLVKEKDVRALTVDIVGAATREATKSTIETLFCPRSDGRYLAMLSTGTLYKLYAAFTVAMALLLYALSPRTVHVMG